MCFIATISLTKFLNMKKHILIILFIGIIIFGYSYSNTKNTIPPHPETGTGSSSQKPIKMVNTRDARYCEILTISGNIGNMVATVYNTLGVNDCPETVWKNIDKEKVKKDFQAKSVVMNGPRVFLMDSVGQFNMPPPKVDIGGIEMIERAHLDVDLKTLLMGKKPYDEQIVKRTTMYIFNTGSSVYLLRHNTDTYIMQSYAKIVDPDLNEEKLKTLANVLKLPSGWTYETKKLDEALILETKENGKAYLVQDELQNSYQKIQ